MTCAPRDEAVSEGWRVELPPDRPTLRHSVAFLGSTTPPVLPRRWRRFAGSRRGIEGPMGSAPHARFAEGAEVSDLVLCGCRGLTANSA